MNVLLYKLSFWEYVVIEGRIMPKKNPVEFDMYKSLRWGMKQELDASRINPRKKEQLYYERNRIVAVEKNPSLDAVGEAITKTERKPHGILMRKESALWSG